MNFKSDFERKAYRTLKRLIDNVTYETERVPYVIRRNYVPDFVCTIGDSGVSGPMEGRTSRRIYIETKGYFSPQDRQKMKLVKQQNPDLDIRLVFLQDNKLNKRTETRYSDWAIKNGFPFSIGSIPKEWFIE